MKFNLSNFFKVGVLFAVTQALGVYVAARFWPNLRQLETYPETGFYLYDFLILAGLVVAVYLLVTKLPRIGSFIFKIFLTILIFAGAQTVFGVWFKGVASEAIAVAIAVLFWQKRYVLVHNAAMILTFAGIGSVIGLSIRPQTAVLILVLLSFYDIVAVYKTKHMVRLAESMIRARAVFGFVVPSSGAGFLKDTAGVSPGGEFMILGSGDVILPLILSASLVPFSMALAIIVAIFSIAGLFLMHLIFTNQRVRRPMAALPPIALMAILGYLLALV